VKRVARGTKFKLNQVFIGLRAVITAATERGEKIKIKSDKSTVSEFINPY
jgi:hypothetical protein